MGQTLKTILLLRQEANRQIKKLIAEMWGEEPKKNIIRKST